MLRAIKVILVLLAVLFISIAMRWLVSPTGVAPEFGFELAHGLGRSTQIGDLFAFFLPASLCMLIGVVQTERLWLCPPLLLFSLAIVGRLVAWLIHDAAFAATQLAVEFVSVVVLLVALRLFPSRKA